MNQNSDLDIILLIMIVGVMLFILTAVGVVDINILHSIALILFPFLIAGFVLLFIFVAMSCVFSVEVLLFIMTTIVETIGRKWNTYWKPLR